MSLKLFYLALAGAVGTLARYGLQGLVQRWTGGSFPWGTLTVNLTGCLLFGLVWALATERYAISGDVRALVLVGFMGAFTTFSTFAFETVGLLRDAEWLLAAANLAAHNLLGVLALSAGWMLGRML